MINGKHGQGTHCTKRVLINWPKVPQMPQNLSAHIVCPSPKVWDFDEKRLHWASVVRGSNLQKKKESRHSAEHLLFRWRVITYLDLNEIENSFKINLPLQEVLQIYVRKETV